MKKEIAIVLSGAIVGGIETALTNMLNAIDCSKYIITLFTNKRGNPCIGNIPPEITIINLEDFSLKALFLNNIKHCNIKNAIKDLICYFCIRISKNEFQKVIYSCKLRSLSQKHYDVAIAYQHTVSMAEVLYSINASKKCVWIHGALLGGSNPEESYLQCFNLFDKIFCVSRSVKHNIEHFCPAIKCKTDIFYNLLDSNYINKSAKNFPVYLGNHEIILCTVGRLGPGKGQEMIPSVAALLKGAGYNFLWYLVGDGPCREKIESEIRNKNVSDNVILLGTQANPYPYIKASNIYVQTSYAEGWCLTVQEAKILCKPIVTTDLPVMREQFTHMKNGYITTGISPESLFEGIKTLIEHPELCEIFVQNLAKEAHDNSSELQKLYNFIDS